MQPNEHTVFKTQGTDIDDAYSIKELENEMFEDCYDDD